VWLAPYAAYVVLVCIQLNCKGGASKRNFVAVMMVDIKHMSNGEQKHNKPVKNHRCGVLKNNFFVAVMAHEKHMSNGRQIHKQCK
jgi:hypothetical protein